MIPRGRILQNDSLSIYLVAHTLLVVFHNPLELVKRANEGVNI